MADNSKIRGFAAKEKKLQEKLDNLQSRHDKARENLEKQGGMDERSMAGAERLLLQIDEVKQELKDLKKERGDGSTRTPTQVKELPPPTKEITVKPHRGSHLRHPGGEGRGLLESVKPFKDPAKNRPATVNTQSKKPIAKRIMEALGDTRAMAQASEDARETKKMEMEREMNVAGRKKGGMAKKKKAPVKKAYGGMVKKKHGGSANKVNMKAGFTRRGCSKG
jgi:hypothetical protein